MSTVFKGILVSVHTFSLHANLTMSAFGVTGTYQSYITARNLFCKTSDNERQLQSTSYFITQTNKFSWFLLSNKNYMQYSVHIDANNHIN